jgi:hypothetical protein
MKAILKSECNDISVNTVFEVSDSTYHAIAEFSKKFETASHRYDALSNTLFRELDHAESTYEKVPDGKYVVFCHSLKDFTTLWLDVILDSKELEIWRQSRIKVTDEESDLIKPLNLAVYQYHHTSKPKTYPIIQFTGRKDLFESSREIQKFLNTNVSRGGYGFLVQPLYSNQGYVRDRNDLRTVFDSDYLMYKNDQIYVCNELYIRNNYVLVED